MQTKPISQLQQGERIRTPHGDAEVIAVKRNTERAPIEIITQVRGQITETVMYERDDNKLVTMAEGGFQPSLF